MSVVLTFVNAFSPITVATAAGRSTNKTCGCVCRQIRSSTALISTGNIRYGGLPGNSKRPEDKHNYTWAMRAIRDERPHKAAATAKYLLTAALGTGHDKIVISKCRSSTAVSVGPV